MKRKVLINFMVIAVIFALGFNVVGDLLSPNVNPVYIVADVMVALLAGIGIAL